MVKRILKIVGIVLAGFVVIAGAAVGIVALTGGFNKEVIHISHLYFGDEQNNIKKTIYLKSDEVVENINFAPLDATEKDLKVDIYGNGEQDNGEIKIIDDISKITAGEDFTIKAKKDSKGNYIGGVVQIVASTGISQVTLTVVVDAVVPNNSMFFTGTTSGKLSTTGKSFTMPISQTTQYVYLKSSLVNAFYLPVNNVNVKSVQIGYTYNYTDGGSTTRDLSSSVTIDSAFNYEQGVRNYFYKIPLTTNEAGTIELTAKMHRTHEIQQAFEEGGFGTLVSKLQAAMNTNSPLDIANANVAITNYNAFLNKYIKYFDTTEESYEFFKHWIPNGVVSFGIENIDAVKQSLEYVYVSCSATINVTAIQLSDFTSTDLKKNSYQVFDQTLYSITGTDISLGNSVENIVDDFGLSIAVDNENISNIDKEKAYLYESLTIKPYLYLDTINNLTDADVDIGDDDSYIVTWAGRTYKALAVYGFDSSNNNMPYTTPNPNDIYGDTITGYLLQLTDSDEYLSVTELNINGEKHWRVSCNTPLPTTQSDTIPTKALYLGFQVSGLANDNSIIAIETYSRVYIDYVDYEFDNANGDNNLKFAFDESNPVKDMTINTNVTDIEGDGILASNLSEQNISLTNNYTNTTSPTYTSIMYFAERTSNVVGSGSKIVTMGKYKFISISDALYHDNSNPYSTIVGERIPTYITSNGSKQYYIKALNASNEPVRIFAVAYLSDKNGNPIDVNGRILTINEADPGTSEEMWPQLVVVRMTEYELDKMIEIKIHSYVDEVNFYTKSLINHSVSGVDFASDTYTLRNTLNSYTLEDGTTLSTSEINSLNDFLKLKLLQSNYFTLYVTPFRLGGEASNEESYAYYYLTDVYGKMSSTAYSYKIERDNNKQLAFNTLCANFDQFKLSIYGYTDVEITEMLFDVGGDNYVASYSPAKDGEEELNVSKIKFVLHATEDATLNSSTSTEGVNNTKIALEPINDYISIPYSSLMYGSTETQNNFVTYQVSKLEIYNVELDSEYEMYTKLFARYANIDTDDEEQKGTLEFRQIVLESGDGIKRTDYYLELEDGNVKYTVENNIMNDEEFNLSLVDSSQAGARDDKPLNYDSSYYSTIEDYVSHYVNGENGTGISYNNAENVMTFERDCEFSNYLVGDYSNEYIHFGSKKFPFTKSEGTSTYSVNINGYILPLTQVDVGDGIYKYSFTIKKGEYFPVVNGNQAIIYNEIFTISDGTGYKYILDYVDKQTSGNQVKVTLTASIITADGANMTYDANKYLSDTNLHSNSAITVENDTTRAKVNFTQGEETAIYVEDANGDYKLVDGDYTLITESNYSGTRYSLSAYEKDELGNLYYNSKTNKYESIGSYDIPINERYTKRGVVVHLLITFNVIKTSDNSALHTFYKVLTYELIQEEIEIVGINGIVNESIEYNEQKNSELILDAGVTADSDNKVNTIYLYGGSGARITTEAQDEIYFFNHVTFTMEFNSTPMTNKDWTIETDGQGVAYAIVINTPNLAEWGSLTLKLSYLYKGEQKTYSYYISIRPNVEFATDISAEEVNDGTYAYKISLNSGATQHIYHTSGTGDTYLINKYFTVGDIVNNVTLTIDEDYANYATISNNVITLATVYANYIDENIIKDYVLCTITLELTDGSTITLNNKLYIEIIPTYIVDLTQVDNEITIFNNESIYVNYVKLYETGTLATDITNNNADPITSISAYSMFTIEFVEFKTNPHNYSSTDITFENGRIKLSSTPTQDTTFSVKISYTEGSADPITKVVTITIIGITQEYTLTGSEVAVDDDKITITLDSLSNFYGVINNYFNFSRTTGENDIQALLIKDGVYVSTLEYGVEYELWYGKASGMGQGFTPIEATTYTVTFAKPSQSE